MNVRGGRDTPTSVEISTGHTVELPVRLDATMVGAVFTVPDATASTLLPDGLRPIRATPGGAAALTLLSVEYHAVGIEGIAPYDEFAVIIPASHESPGDVPYLSAIRHATDGYVWRMPVTTDPACAFGVDVWGFPKSVADITHEATPEGRRTTVTADGDRFITVDIDRPPAVRIQDDGLSYTVKDGVVHRVPNEIDAAMGAWPYSDVSVSLGPHPDADELRSVDFGGRALARLSLEGAVYFGAGEPVNRRSERISIVE